MSRNRPHCAIEGTQAQWPLPLAKCYLDSSWRRCGVDDTSALRPHLQLQAPPPRQPADHPGCQQAADSKQR
jgi:hypothetical protein